jgi:hypothetical protein
MKRNSHNRTSKAELFQYSYSVLELIATIMPLKKDFSKIFLGLAEKIWCPVLNLERFMQEGMQNTQN